MRNCAFAVGGDLQDSVLMDKLHAQASGLACCPNLLFYLFIFHNTCSLCKLEFKLDLTHFNKKQLLTKFSASVFKIKKNVFLMGALAKCFHLLFVTWLQRKRWVSIKVLLNNYLSNYFTLLIIYYTKKNLLCSHCSLFSSQFQSVHLAQITRNRWSLCRTAL